MCGCVLLEFVIHNKSLIRYVHNTTQTYSVLLTLEKVVFFLVCSQCFKSRSETAIAATL